MAEDANAGMYTSNLQAGSQAFATRQGKPELLTMVPRIAWPLADAALTQEILDLLQSATHLRQAKKGANEGTYTLGSFEYARRSRGDIALVRGDD